MIETLSKAIVAQPRFQSEFWDLQILAVQEAIGLEVEPSDIGEAQVLRLLQAAGILSLSSVEGNRSLAHKIVAALATSSLPARENLLHVAKAVFERLGNFPASDQMGAAQVEISSRIRLEMEIHRDANLIAVGSAELPLTDQQYRIWDRLASREPLAISAPTSYGKSFLLAHFLMRRLRESARFSAVYLVPTRALIGQVARDLLISAKTTGDRGGIWLSTSPSSLAPPDKPHQLFVLTPERLLLLFELHPEFRPDLVVVDEAQLIGKEDRGVTLQSALEHLGDGPGETQIVFLAPLVSNPDEFLRATSSQTGRHLLVSESPVVQNVVRADTNRESGRLELSLRQGPDSYIRLGELSLKDELADEVAVLSVIPSMFASSGSSIVYAQSPPKAEAVSEALANLLPTQDNAALNELASFIAVHVHEEYPLVDSVRRGVAFHHGRLPSIIRRGVEDAFRANDLTFLVTTSTLLYGINTAARNVFVYRPKTANKRMQSADFWNLAGRAGRLTADFAGNVFVINPEKWVENLVETDRESEVHTGLEIHLHTQFDALLEYAQSGDPHVLKPRTRCGLENAFTKLFVDQAENRLQITLGRLSNRLPTEREQQLSAAVAVAVENCGLDTRMVAANATISPFRQAALRDEIVELVRSGRIQNHVVTNLYASGAYGDLRNMFSLLLTTLQGTDKSIDFYTWIAFEWMKGAPLSVIIKKRLSRKREGDPSYSVSLAVQDVMKAVENGLRYDFMRFTHCYYDYVQEILPEHGLSDLAERCLPIHMYLELGASSQTMRSLVGLGLSRTTARLLQENLGDSTLTSEQCLAQLRARVVALRRSLPRLCYEELIDLV